MLALCNPRDPVRFVISERASYNGEGSVDGRIVTGGWPLSREGGRQYEEVHATYNPEAWICGRVTMEQHFAAGTRSDAEVARATRARRATTSLLRARINRSPSRSTLAESSYGNPATWTETTSSRC